ncbi:FG-GAP and VCBS repeat-containing protein [Actinomadura violacea]|uniref:VCBS repeat-containing protein n=1 Tax=Actinomadura violacea TaxID=2819934 RepID=A0ABS3S4E3_9ACTN|nr:VCBS repeat-containing protein [Actinomadura violacea]MBO2463879.1 VCBS repeat-containing protein [Actinomadura violacea]
MIAVGVALTAGLAAAAPLADDQGSKAAPGTWSTPGTAAPLRPVLPARPATFTKPAKHADFNGDGYGDIVVPGPGWGKDPSRGLSFVEVVYGSPAGLTPSRRQSIGPSTSGIPGTAYGAQMGAAADFDRDGYADLALESVEDGGSSVVIFYGSATGLSGRSIALKGPGDFSFDTLAVGDFDGTAGTDVVVTGKGECWVFRDITTKPVPGTKIPVTGRIGAKIRRGSVGPGSVAAARAPVVADVNGDRRSDLVLVVATPAADGEEGEDFWNAELRLGTVNGLSTKAVGFGNDQVSERPAPVAGDVDGDGRTDVIVTGPETGTITAFLGTAGGLAPGKQIRLPFTGEVKRLAVGDTDGDGKADLAAFNAYTATAVLPGGRGGLDLARAQRFDKATPGLPAAPGNDLRGFADMASLTDVNGDGKADLIVEAPQENAPDQDRVFILPGSDSGVTIKGATAFSGAALR